MFLAKYRKNTPISDGFNMYFLCIVNAFFEKKEAFINFRILKMPKFSKHR